jgi:peptidoglycan/xylan/chitin deacetylase (PgdA/CDA1 family)
VDDWNVPPVLFERQIAALARFAEIVALPDLPRMLKMSPPLPKPVVCLTFDDGYANFHSRVLPILRRHHAPATAFVVTGLIGRQEPLPFDSWSQRHRNRVGPEAWRSMDWEELEACVESGLVTVGAHSHSHLLGRDCTPAQLVEEAEESRAVLARRLGEAQMPMYAYPYGSTRLGYVPPDYVRAVRAAGFLLAVTTDLGLADGDCDPYLMPRVEAHAVDGPGGLAAKARGVLGPYYFTDRLRKAKRPT